MGPIRQLKGKEEFMKAVDETGHAAPEAEGEKKKEGGATRAYAIKDAEGFVKVYEDIKKLRNDFVDMKIENNAYRSMVGRTEWFAVFVGANTLPSAFFRTRASAENWARSVNSLSQADFRVVSFNTASTPFKIEEM